MATRHALGSSAAALPVLISARQNPLLVRVRRLARDPAAYRKAGQVWLEGEHLCSALLLRGGQAAQALVSESAWQSQPLRALAQAAAKVALLPDELFDSLSPLGSAAGLAFLYELPELAPIAPRLPTLVLDRVQDAGNVGSILRSAAALGIAQVLSLSGSAALWSPKVLRAGMGAHFGLRLLEGLDAADVAGLDLPLLAASAHAGTPLPSTRLPWPCAWVLGHEGQGVSEALLRLCSMQVSIPQPGGEESLNVSAAAAICLYESARQRMDQTAAT